MKGIVRLLVVCILSTVIATQQVNGDDAGNFNVGVGIADVTGPAADIGMMGYAALDQIAAGIHIRLFARAFIFESDGERVVYVSSDIGMVDQAIKTAVVEELFERFGSVYHAKNVLLSGTHTHSGPAGYIQYLLYGITSLGFNTQNFRAIVDGIVESIEKAHANMQPGKLFFSKGELLEANVNRSPTSYLANPVEERANYDYDADKDMSLLRIEDAEGNPLGLINWFAVHPTSMQNINKLISGDNKGYAEQMFEKKMNPNDRPGKGKFVAAFGSANLGDVSPNTKGPKCVPGGVGADWDVWEDLEDCHPEHSTCCGPLGCFVNNCFAVGPGDKDMEESTRIIGEKQFLKAEELFESPEAEQISGPVQHQHQYVKMDEYKVTVEDPETGIKEEKQLCKAALGFGFAAGTTDGPGAFDFKQGDTNVSHPFWDFIKDFLINATDEIVACQYPKPVLLAVGEAYLPYEWVPSIVETQILRIGDLFMVAVPGELTTMAGRRVRALVERIVREKYPGSNPKVVIAGLSNVYTHYIATIEEYGKQRYEAASTIYGPHTLEAYMKQYQILLDSMLEGTHVDVGPTPPNLLDKQFSLVAPITVDTTPLLHEFGDVLTQPDPTITAGQTVKAEFVAGHPKNDAMRGGTFFTVEKMNDGTSRWDIVRIDADWDTKFVWRRPSLGSTENIVEISWKVPTDAPEGVYRIRHFGYYKPYSESPRPYQGSTASFQIVSSSASKPKEHPLWNPNPTRTKKIRSTRQLWNTLGMKF